MRSKVAHDDILDLRDGIIVDLDDALIEVDHAQDEVTAARRVLQLAEKRLKRAQKKTEQLKKRYEICERRVAPAGEEHFGAGEVMHDANANAMILKTGPVFEFDVKPDCLSADRARNVSGEVGERAIQSLNAASPYRSQMRKRRHRPYPTTKDLLPRVAPLLEERKPQNFSSVRISKLDEEDTVIDVGYNSSLIRRDPEAVWADFLPQSKDEELEWNEAHKNDLLNMLDMGLDRQSHLSK